jgi:murein DD-endopeptidase MepM/ murein hydrolase activator NlpD
MRVSHKLLVLLGLLVILSGCVQPAEVQSEESAYTPTSTLSVTQVPQEESTEIAAPAATATLTPIPTPTLIPFPPEMGCGEVFCQQSWPGLLERPFTADYTLKIDPTYPYAGTKNGTMDPHHGVEFPNGYGTPVLAARNGTVVFAGSDDLTVIGPYTAFYGNVVILKHTGLFEGRDLYTLYGHLSEISVSEGDEVTVGQLVGKVGSSGAADGPHLHFEVRLDENTYAASTNPMLWFAPVVDPMLGQTGTLAGLIVNRYGTPLDRFTLSLELLDAGGNVIETFYPITYYPAGVNGFPPLGENFVMPDLPPGDYRLAFIYNTLHEVLFTLQPGSLGFINLQLD